MKCPLCVSAATAWRTDQAAFFNSCISKFQQLVATFMRYYRIIISDRRAYTARLRQFDLAPYRETIEGGGPVTNIVTDFTSGNDIKECVPPGELGGDA